MCSSDLIKVCELCESHRNVPLELVPVEIEHPEVGQVVERVRDHSLQFVARQIPAMIQFSLVSHTY